MNLNLEKLRLSLRLASEQAVLDQRAFHFASEELLTVGKMIGGWMRSRPEGEPG